MSRMVDKKISERELLAGEVEVKNSLYRGIWQSSAG